MLLYTHIHKFEQLLYQWGDPSKDAELRKLAIVFVAQLEDRLEAFNLAVHKCLWEASIQA
jgi:hypothetical protein